MNSSILSNFDFSFIPHRLMRMASGLKSHLLKRYIQKVAKSLEMALSTAIAEALYVIPQQNSMIPK